MVKEQRIDRVIAYARELTRRLDELDRAINGDNALTVDLLEDTVIQSSRALSDDRNRYLASIMVDSADVTPEHYEFNKKLLQILAELTDVDIEVLEAHTDFVKLHAFRRRWKYTEPMTIAERRQLSTEDKFRRDATQVAFDVHVAALERYGLLIAERERPRGSIHMVEHGGPMPEAVGHLDEFGMPKITGYKVTRLGRLLLTRIFGADFD